MKESDILEAVKNIRKEGSFFALGGRTWFARHCGLRMMRVRVYANGGKCPTHNAKERKVDEVFCLCPDCNYHYTDCQWD